MGKIKSTEYTEPNRRAGRRNSSQRAKRYFPTVYCKGRQAATRQMLNTSLLLFSNAIPDGKCAIFIDLTQFLVYLC